MRALLFVFCLLAGLPAQAGSVRVATASNFVPTMAALAKAFEADTGHRVDVMAGSSGAIYAQILQGAPFDMFLSADAARPAKLVDAKQAAPEHKATYALGALALWSRKEVSFPDASTASAYLTALPPRQLASANPATAPYGQAAQQTLLALGVEPRQLVTGQNIGQAFSLVASGNVDAGFVAASQLTSVTLGSIWRVPPSLHQPIQQDMVLLARARGNKAAKALFAWLQSPAARALIVKAGYSLPAQP
ncbi:MAG: molybdate ABC transporter substrate-binding protein [Pseudomonadota bacterium]